MDIDIRVGSSRQVRDFEVFTGREGLIEMGFPLYLREGVQSQVFFFFGFFLFFLAE